MLGHSQEDNLLQSIAKAIEDNTRSIDIVSRVGGDEFVIFFLKLRRKLQKKQLIRCEKDFLPWLKITICQ
jgi:diguanylate cyclase (GGDEF)-like protein